MQTKQLNSSKEIWELDKILGEPKTRKEVLAEIVQDEDVKHYYEKLPDNLQREFISFCMGNRGLKITYDPFFKFIFNPVQHPERLSELLSLILQQEVEIVEVLPNESTRVTEDSSLLITDIVVRLRDGSYADVEIQKIGYAFPGQRCACYSSDLLLRQLVRAKNAAKDNAQKFSYGDLKRVYTIVFIEDSPSIYWQHPTSYIHRGKQTFDTGLELDLLQEFILIPLDIFKKIPHNEINKLDAWLYFIGSDEPSDICKIVVLYPEFKELYNELIGLRYNMKGLTSMFDYYRQLLKEADEGTVQYMIEQQKKEIEENKKVISDQKQTIFDQQQIITDKDTQIADKDATIADKDATIADKDAQIAYWKALAEKAQS